MTPDLSEPGNLHLKPGWNPHLTLLEKATLIHVLSPEWGWRKIVWAINETAQTYEKGTADLRLIGKAELKFSVFMAEVAIPLKQMEFRSHPRSETCPVCQGVLSEMHEGREYDPGAQIAPTRAGHIENSVYRCAYGYEAGGKSMCLGENKLRVPEGEAGLPGVTGVFACDRHAAEHLIGYEAWKTTPTKAAGNRARKNKGADWD